MILSRHCCCDFLIHNDTVFKPQEYFVHVKTLVTFSYHRILLIETIAVLITLKNEVRKTNYTPGKVINLDKQETN